MKTIAIIGAGPAGLSAAYEILKQSNNYKITIFEKEENVGGLSRSFTFNGGKVDIGGHRFFTKNEAVKKLWDDVLPISDKGMLLKNRKSHILYNNKLVEYPLQLNLSTIQSLGLSKGIKAILSYLFHSKNDTKISTLKDFYIRRFGKELYTEFFEKYTFKLWGIPACELSSDWGEQRIQKVSLTDLLSSMLLNKNKNERSLTKEFYYPAFGCGQFWDELATKVVANGCTIEKIVALTDLK